MTDDQHSATRETAAPGTARRLSTAALWVSIVALVTSAVLAVIFQPVLRSWLVVLLLLAVAAGVVGLVMGVRSRRGGRTGAGTWALTSALAAILVDIALILSVAVGVSTAFGADTNTVIVRGQGPAGITAEYWGELVPRTQEVWPASGSAQLDTESSWVKITVTAPTGSAQSSVSCQIVWGGEVVDESSARGTVTCRYDAP
jgi:hypothetical protein